jgi:ABC-type transporter MlaC component
MRNTGLFHRHVLCLRRAGRGPVKPTPTRSVGYRQEVQIHVRKLSLSLLSLSLLLPLAAHAEADATAARGRTEALIATFQKLGKDPGANRKVFEQLDGFFDYERLTEVPITPIASKFTPAQKAEFSRKFKELIRGLSFGDSGSFFRRAKLTWGAPRAESGEVVVPLDAHDPDQDLDTSIEFRWAGAEGKLRLVDASFDGTSLTKDYQNQFARIVEKEGVPGLLKRLDERRADAEKKGSFAK